MRDICFMRRTCWRSLRILTLSLVLAGCSSQPAPQRPVASEVTPVVHPVPQDRVHSCDAFWSVRRQHEEASPLYWLQAMDCAVQLTPAEARAEASRWPDDTWQDAFRRSILLGKARIMPLERNQQVGALDAMYHQVPAELRGLYQLWRDGQANEYQLSLARTRFSDLQQSSDQQLDGMRREQQQLHSQLAQTRHKLQTLTDIERQLSSRKASSLDSHSSVLENERRDDAPAREESHP